MAIDLRRSQAQRIKAQTGAGRRRLSAAETVQGIEREEGRIKRQKAAMFAKIRTAKHLKAKTTSEQVEVGFFGWVVRVSHVHQFGQQDRVSNKGHTYKYPVRPLLGLSELDRTSNREVIPPFLERAKSRG